VILGSLPVYAWAGDDSCLDQVRAQVVNRALPPLAATYGLEYQGGQAPEGSIETEEFIRKIQGHSIGSLVYAYVQKMNNVTVRTAFTFEAPSATSDNIFVLSQDVEIWGADLTPLSERTTSFWTRFKT
jgi:hypothetical protein